jgi:hypothetical protein
MSDAAERGQAAAAGPAQWPEPRRRSSTRRWVTAGVVVVVAAGTAAGLVITDPFASKPQPNPGLGNNLYPTALATVTRQTLVAQTEVPATVGDKDSFSVLNNMTGTFTQLPAVGQVVHQGSVLYRVDGQPVVLLYGSVPAYRTLSDGMYGPDVTQLNRALVTLGYATRSQVDPNSNCFTLETAYALERLQTHLGVTVTGYLSLGQAIFLPTTVKITALGGGAVLGASAQAGGTVLTATSTVKIVSIALDVADQSAVRVGEHVAITLPDNQTTPGVVSSVGTVATAPPSGSTTSPTITVLVTPSNPGALAGLTSSPVNVTITTASANNVLVVPVTALLAQPGSGYAVEVAGAGGVHHLVSVTPGTFDDAHGLVSVSGPGLTAGQRVVVPAS